MCKNLKSFGALLYLYFVFQSACAQQSLITGKIEDETTADKLDGVLVRLEKTTFQTKSDANGVFYFRQLDLPEGSYILSFSKTAYRPKRIPIRVQKSNTLDLQIIKLEFDIDKEQLHTGTISLSDNELDDSDDDASASVSGLLQASRDVFLGAVAFDFSAAFFRPRGLGNSNAKVLVNGIVMNKLENGRPLWGNWGGLNDVQRYQELYRNTSPNPYDFGDLSGTTNIAMRASKFRKGSRISYAASNRSYTGRMMATYNSGVQRTGLAYSISLSRRFGEEGFIQGTNYNAYSIFASVEKKFNANHSINLTSFFTPNRRGRSTAITSEVYDLKSRTYNPNWGFYDGKKRNARIRKIEEPVVILNHYWTFRDRFFLNTNLGIQTGFVANTRLDNNGADLQLSNDGQESYSGGGASRDTNPMHPSYLPSFYLQDPNPSTSNYRSAYEARDTFEQGGLLNWKQLIEANQRQAALGKNATYIWYEDRSDATKWILNTIFEGHLNQKFSLQGKLNFQNTKHNNYAKVIDLLGGNGFLDIDVFATAVDNDAATNFSSTELANRAQSNLRNRNRIVTVGEDYDYNYQIDSSVFEAFAQGQFQMNALQLYAGASVSRTAYQRTGNYENGYFPGIGDLGSFGKSRQETFQNIGIKSGGKFQLDGRHAIGIQTAYFGKAPTIRSTFANARQNNRTVSMILEAQFQKEKEELSNGERSQIQISDTKQKNETYTLLEASYNYTSPKIKARLSGYHTNIQNATAISFFFTQAISGSDQGFVQEILTGINKRHFGLEFGLSYDISATLQAKTALSIGNYTYSNSPDLFISSTSGALQDEQQSVGSDFRGTQYFGKSNIKGYKLATGPQQAFQLGMTYRNPEFWWIGATVNYFAKSYVAISPFARTQNFYKDADGLPFNDFDPVIAQKLLQQEVFDPYILVNLVGGNSWKIKKYYIGFFASIQNVLDKKYRTGGFEQSRRANYRAALEESQRDTPVFGSRYFYGLGTTFYLSLYLRL